MSTNPTRQFSANVNQLSNTTTTGPDGIELSLDDIIRWIAEHKDPTDTDHDGRYYTEAEVDAKLQSITQGAVADGSITLTKLATDANTAINGKMDKSILTTQGDIIYASGADTPVRLGKGTAGQVLQIKSDGTVPEWGDSYLTKIAEVTLTGSQANITFNSIPQTFKALKVMHKLRTDQAAESSTVNIKFNNDATNTHKSSLLYYNPSIGVQSNYTLLNPLTSIGVSATGSTATANNFGMGEINIPNYTEAINKRGFSTYNINGGSNASWQLGFGDIQWASTAAINTISLIPASGNFVAGSSVILYGIK